MGWIRSDWTKNGEAAAPTRLTTDISPIPEFLHQEPHGKDVVMEGCGSGWVGGGDGVWVGWEVVYMHVLYRVFFDCSFSPMTSMLLLALNKA